MKTPLFSTYRSGENRVTSSIVAVFERLGLGLLERVLQAATEDPALETARFINQPSGEGSVPDAEVSARFRYLFEVKTTQGTIRGEGARTQLESHLGGLDGTYGDERLFVLTPDLGVPPLIDEIGDRRVTWVGFEALAAAIAAVMGSPDEVASESDRFLLRELLALFEAEGLTGVEDTVIVAARSAYPEYLEKAAYICQPNRSFRPNLARLGFYTAREIKPPVPAILDHLVDVEFTEKRSAEMEATGNRTAAEVIRACLEDGSRIEGEHYDVVLLSAPTDDQTLVLDDPIPHPTGFAWTMGQRYVRADWLSTATTTTRDLD